MTHNRSNDRAYRIRSAEAGDAPFLWEMLFQSLFVREGDPPFERSVLDEPAIRKYMEDWGRAGDTGFVAESEQGRPLGAVTARFFDEAHKGYGYVADDVPELGMALLPEARGLGLGTALLEALFEKLREDGVERVSLSVDPGNEPAVKLYRRFGFEEAGREGTSITMTARPGTNS
ncbi:GNAT family N-acetyltransferase [Saccharibacillus sp. CPCC 101409]|uniref:GNAT family N-acetyltransferase n=1 Tax=Saccharibacillus sp. CPCC 101409 TaxID=3058041 RepID=UPI0026711942|nr:GNAT family N-acetyltransferase [Saccharibacillus sp. CPCC 101409]MDO3410482.1 GNAT family N-acetyltransferase [Saccharibacillus sp. CPCC 101409]